MTKEQLKQRLDHAYSRYLMLSNNDTYSVTGKAIDQAYNDYIEAKQEYEKATA